jgi:hypothetical protein
MVTFPIRNTPAAKKYLLRHCGTAVANSCVPGTQGHAARVPFEGLLCKAITSTASTESTVPTCAAWQTMAAPTRTQRPMTSANSGACPVRMTKPAGKKSPSKLKRNPQVRRLRSRRGESSQITGRQVVKVALLPCESIPLEPDAREPRDSRSRAGFVLKNTTRRTCLLPSAEYADEDPSRTTARAVAGQSECSGVRSLYGAGT